MTIPPSTAESIRLSETDPGTTDRVGIYGHAPGGRVYYDIDRGWADYFRAGPAETTPITTPDPIVWCEPHVQ